MVKHVTILSSNSTTRYTPKKNENITIPKLVIAFMYKFRYINVPKPIKTRSGLVVT